MAPAVKKKTTTSISTVSPRLFAAAVLTSKLTSERVTEESGLAEV
jgi:hypothetical protein